MVEVHFFSLDLDTSRFLHVLSSDEHDRAARFRFDVHRNRYIVCRGKLREMLGSHLGVIPTGLAFSYGSHGKPFLAQGEIQFNVSHSHNMGMIAVSAVEVGCDIERIDPKFADEQIPERFFSPSEVAALRALPVGEQRDAFFRIWTRKEAFIKACGLGVSMGLDTFDVTLAPDPKLLRGPDGWDFHAVNAPHGYAAAVVLRK
jgi:4'-phosphopantetheinyl transferase